ncbi:HAMP domain-containing methyl-accepting chemotaxis protein [Peredibacter starrii]|uniref:Methyl-accepting chemotaxis protein n=1 Tax=Peredibacter starrii TaxID=28202 RepID=A0AAX4HLK3_9BACT|nr:methyl-accepting chemotaxis protein [Peredibacter starrii]WPU64139.1 methyl-accepting chemotaxis protein [Peredibacter starrii]
MFGNSSLKGKLLFAFTFVSLFVVVVAGVGYFSMNKVQREYSYISDILVDNIQKVSELNDAGQEANRQLFRGLINVHANQSIYDQILGDYKEQSSRFARLDKEYRSTPFEPGEEALYDKVWSSWTKYEEATDKYFKKLDEIRTTKSNDDELRNFLNQNLRHLRGDIRKSFEDLMAFQSNVSKERAKIATTAYNTASLLSLVISVAGVVFAIGVGLYFSTTISNTISKIAENILSSSTQTASASQQLTSASSQLSQGATESAASLEETVSSLEELSSMVKLNSDHAKEANSLSQKSLTSAEQGERDISRLITAMGDMSKSSKKIEEIINVIDDIAFQTNLLALNAAVEAARAGEQGKGFAVVADAVRNLAQRSASAAKDINTLIKENVEKTEEGVDIADTSGTSLKDILNSVKKVADLNSEIAAASQEQASGIEQISKAMNHLDQAIQSNASSSEEVASSAAEMSSQADCLSELVFDMKKFIEGKSSDAETVVAKAPSRTKSSPKLKVVSSIHTKKAKDDFFPMDDDAPSVGKAEGF